MYVLPMLLESARAAEYSAGMTCRNCGGLRLKRLRRRSLLSRVMKVFGLGPWKCELCDAESFGPSRIAGRSHSAI
jgi:hypothetical protein